MDLAAFLDEVQSIARTGLHFSPTPYDRERFERLTDLCAAAYADLAQLRPGEVAERFGRELGYVTAKVGVSVAIADGQGRLRLVRRSDDGRWSLVSGYLDPNEHPEECARREVAEETGLDVRIDGLVGVHHRPASAGWPHSLVSILYRATEVGGVVRLAEHEVTETGWFRPDEVDDWHLDHRRLAERALADGTIAPSSADLEEIPPEV